MYILGAGGFAREVALVAQEMGYQIDGYLSDDPLQKGNDLVFARCLGTIEEQPTGSAYFMPGVGSPELRKQLVLRAIEHGWQSVDGLISPRAMLPSHKGKAKFSYGKGTVFCSGVSGTVNVSIGKYVNVNLNCTLGHDCVLEDFVNLAPDVNVSGYAHLEEGVDVGTGAVILPHVRIGKRAVIGAGATVTKNVPPGEVWVGTPAKFLRTIG